MLPPAASPRNCIAGYLAAWCPASQSNQHGFCGARAGSCTAAWPCLLHFHSLQKTVVSWGREEFIALRNVSFASKPAAVSKTVSSGTLAHVEILCEAQQLRTTELGLEALCTHHGQRFPERCSRNRSNSVNPWRQRHLGAGGNP